MDTQPPLLRPPFFKDDVWNTPAPSPPEKGDLRSNPVSQITDMRRCERFLPHLLMASPAWKSYLHFPQNASPPIKTCFLAYVTSALAPKTAGRSKVLMDSGTVLKYNVPMDLSKMHIRVKRPSKQQRWLWSKDCGLKTSQSWFPTHNPHLKYIYIHKSH